MEDWKKKIKDLSIRKKIISYTYVILIPLMLILCMLLTVYSYSEKKKLIRRVSRKWWTVWKMQSICCSRR